MLDSPYVRRVAISLRLLGIHFEHRSISVFSTYAQFRQINPVVKAPSLVCDDGEVLKDSNLILEYAEVLKPGSRSLVAATRTERQHELRIIGLALAACEKAVQIVYERELRPLEKQHPPWLSRVQGQLQAAYGELESELQRAPLDASSERISQAGVTAAVAWQFTHMRVPGIVSPSDHPALEAFSQRAEQLPEFLAAPPK